MRKYQSIRTIMAAIVSLFFLTVSASAAMESAAFAEITIGRDFMIVDGTSSRSLGTAPVLVADENGETCQMIPVKATAEAFGYTVEWVQETKAIQMKNGNRTICLYADSRRVNCSEHKTSALEVPVQIINGYAMAPAAFFSEYLDCRLVSGKSQEELILSVLTPGADLIGLGQMRKYLEESGRVDNGMTVAVIDTGVDITHPYLQGRLVQGHNAIDNNDDLTDISGHGTHIAGIIANCTPATVKIMPVKAVSQKSNPDSKTISDAIIYAVEHGAKVINISLNAAALPHEKQITDAVNTAVSAGCSVVVAAGNYGKDVKNYALASAENAVVVTAVNQNKTILSTSNYGETVTLAAPGVDVVSAISGGGFDMKTGTSMASAYVSAATAMLYMDTPGIKPEEMKRLLTWYTQDAGEPGPDTVYGSGIVDLARYVDNRKNGTTEVFAKSFQERTKALDTEIEKIYQNIRLNFSNADPALFQSRFAAELINEAIQKREQHDYIGAGYFLETAIANNDAVNSVGKNNLAFLLRRGEYVSYQYNARDLLSAAMADHQPFAYINMALLEASGHRWEAAEELIKKLYLQHSDWAIIKEISAFWETLSNTGDAEGHLIQAWLMRWHMYKDAACSQQEHLKLARQKYADIPEWMSETAKLKEEE